jgi:hypothetical protein
MNELQLPPAPPLPDDVRERVLRTVLAGTGAPHRRFAPLVAAAVAVVTTLAITTSVALIGTGADGPAAQQATTIGPAQLDSATVDEALGRCVTAVTGSEDSGNYPPPAEWRITDVLPMTDDALNEDDPGIALVIDNSFACNPGRYYVNVSTVGGTPAGAVEITRLTGSDFVLFNPQRLEVTVGFDGDNTRSSTAAVQIIGDSPYAVGGPAQRLVVPGSYDGPLPETAGVAIGVQDRPLPDPKPDESQVLEYCLWEQLGPLEYRTGEPRRTVLTQDAYENTPRALVGRVSGKRAAVCYDDPGGPVAAGGDLDPDRDAETRIVTSSRRDGLVVALMTITPGTERVEIATVPLPGSVGSGATCTLRDGLALCMLRAEGAVDVRTIGGGASSTLPVP